MSSNKLAAKIASVSTAIARRAMLRRQDGANPQAAQDLEWASEQVIGILVEGSEPMPLPESSCLMCNGSKRVILPLLGAPTVFNCPECVK